MDLPCRECPKKCAIWRPELQHPYVPTRPWSEGGKRHEKALLIVGEAPGREEDEQGRAFVGPTGRFFLGQVFITGHRLEDLADVYVGNACRCRPVQNHTPTKSQLRACRSLLVEDIRLLQAAYGEVVLLATGASACRTLTGMSLKRFLPHNGRVIEVEGVKPCRVFATNHPAVLIPGRDPNAILSIGDHLALLVQYLKGEPVLRPPTPGYGMATPPPEYRIPRLSLDIETYGKVSLEPDQTCFHPVRSRLFDRPKHILVCAAVAWRDPEGGMHAAAFDLRSRAQRNLLAKYVRQSDSIVGMNVKYDLIYLRTDPVLGTALRQPLRLVDLGILSYLHSEQRPERSLKAIAPLLGITDYSAESEVDGSYKRYPRYDDPDLYDYNVKDAWSTLLAVEAFEKRIEQDFPGSDKLSETSRQWYSDLLWTVIGMEEDGVHFDRQALEDLDFKLVLDSALVWSRAMHKHGLVLKGKGTETSGRLLFEYALGEAALEGDRRIAWTPKRRVLAVNQGNANLFLQHLDPQSQTAVMIRLQQEYERLQKVVTSYTRPLLHGTKKNPVSCRLTPDGLAFPSWFAVPSAQESGTEGGTIQGRITSKGPACQVLPPVVKQTLAPRLNPGFLACADLSQIEMRVAALLSGDPLMLAEYAEGIDRHTQTALRIVKELLSWMTHSGMDTLTLAGTSYTRDVLSGCLTTTEPRKLSGFDLLRQMGKTENFLTIYWGSPGRLQQTIAVDLGVSLPIEVCVGLIEADRSRYKVLAAWQEELIARAKREHRLELPFTGQSRWFLGNDWSVDEMRKEIVNFPIQTTAANVMLDIQRTLRERLLKRKRKTFMGLNIYDSVFLDGPLVEKGPVLGIVAEVFRRSDYLDRWVQRLGRMVPIDYAVTVVVSPAPQENPRG